MIDHIVSAIHVYLYLFLGWLIIALIWGAYLASQDNDNDKD